MEGHMHSLAAVLPEGSSINFLPSADTLLEWHTWSRYFLFPRTVRRGKNLAHDTVLVLAPAAHGGVTDKRRLWQSGDRFFTCILYAP